MSFAAISLLLTESLHSAKTPAPDTKLQDTRHLPPTYVSSAKALASRVWRADMSNQFPAQPPEGPLLLWSLTLGVVADFLDLLPPHTALELWTYPTFAPLDVRFWVWLFTYRFKERKRVELYAGSSVMMSRPSFGGASESLASSSDGKLEGMADGEVKARTDETGLHGLGTGSGVGVGGMGGDARVRGRKAAVVTMLEGYYDIVRRAVGVALVGRATVLAVVLWIVLRRWRARRVGRYVR
ncbi:hypothetical protein LTR81_026497 [Elasticomyces elasticus]